MTARRVLIVDDSAFFRKRLGQILDDGQDLKVVGMAADGREAVGMAVAMQPDIITMDIEMPVMDGITAVRRIMAQCPTPILMFSSLTREGARATLEALEAGAVDFLPKQFDAFVQDPERAGRRLREKVLKLARRGLGPAVRNGAGTSRTNPPAQQENVGSAGNPGLARPGNYRVVAIGCSTGGPVALEKVLSELPAGYPVPLLLIQHMPSSFTPAFAERLNQLVELNVKEAEDGEEALAGHAYLAPGGRQMMAESHGGRLRLRVLDGEPGLIYKPSVDVTFGSLARAGVKGVLALVLTGMGQDGREGARLLKAQGATIWAQDEASSTIYGMPGAVVQAGLADAVLPLSEIGPSLRAVRARR